MSRPSELLDPTAVGTDTSIRDPDQTYHVTTTAASHHRTSSISTPLEALVLETSASPFVRQTAMSLTSEPPIAEANDKDPLTITSTILPNQLRDVFSNSEAVKQEVQSGIENQLPVAPTGVNEKVDQQANEHPSQIPQIKKEESQGAASIRGESPSVSGVSMPPKAAPKKKATTRKPGPKKRKLEADSRANTPQSQRSGTPNSLLGGKTGPRARKPNSATPLQSSPAPGEDDNDDDEESDNELYCICRKPDDHTWMIACDICDDWFHGRCVGMVERDASLIDRFICKKFQNSTFIRLTMCRSQLFDI
jgi:hypothetical protein